MVSGQWEVVSEEWEVVSGQWKVVSEKWKVVSRQPIDSLTKTEKNHTSMLRSARALRLMSATFPLRNSKYPCAPIIAALSPQSDSSG